MNTIVSINFISDNMNQQLHYPKCGTCRKAIKWLNENNIDFNPRDIVTEKPSKEELATWIRMSELPVQKFFNTSGQIYKERNLKEIVKTASEEELIELLASEGKLVKRPVFVNDDMILVGFKEPEWTEKLK